MKPRLLLADCVVEQIAPELRAKRLRLAERSCAGVEECNARAKAAFRELVTAVLGKKSIREQAEFFEVPHSTYNERISDRRSDLAPLDEWTAKLDRHAQWQRLNAEFLRTA